MENIRKVIEKDPEAESLKEKGDYLRAARRYLEKTEPYLDENNEATEEELMEVMAYLERAEECIKRSDEEPIKILEVYRSIDEGYGRYTPKVGRLGSEFLHEAAIDNSWKVGKRLRELEKELEEKGGMRRTVATIFGISVLALMLLTFSSVITGNVIGFIKAYSIQGIVLIAPFLVMVMLGYRYVRKKRSEQAI